MVQNRKHYARATCSTLPVDCFHTKTVVVLHLHDTVARFRTGVNSRPSKRNRVNSRQGDSRQHNILRWYHVNKYRAIRGKRSELTPGRKLPQCHVNTPLVTPAKQCQFLNELNKLLEIHFKFPSSLIGKLTMAFLTGQS